VACCTPRTSLYVDICKFFSSHNRLSILTRMARSARQSSIVYQEPLSNCSIGMAVEMLRSQLSSKPARKRTRA
jgi:hypothetical protein